MISRLEKGTNILNIKTLESHNHLQLWENSTQQTWDRKPRNAPNSMRNFTIRYQGSTRKQNKKLSLYIMRIGNYS